MAVLLSVSPFWGDTDDTVGLSDPTLGTYKVMHSCLDTPPIASRARKHATWLPALDCDGVQVNK